MFVGPAWACFTNGFHSFSVKSGQYFFFERPGYRKERSLDDATFPELFPESSLEFFEGGIPSFVDLRAHFTEGLAFGFGRLGRQLEFRSDSSPVLSFLGEIQRRKEFPPDRIFRGKGFFVLEKVGRGGFPEVPFSIDFHPCFEDGFHIRGEGARGEEGVLSRGFVIEVFSQSIPSRGSIRGSDELHHFSRRFLGRK